MNTKPYIIDDVIYHIPEKVAEAVSEMHEEIYDNRGMKRELKDQITENGKLYLRVEDLKRQLSSGVKIIIPDKYNPENVELDEEYCVPERVKEYIEDLYEVIRVMEGEIESLVEESVAQ